MKLYFTEEQKQQELHKVYLEEDDLLLEVESVEGEGRGYLLVGIATIEGERYHDFEVQIELAEDAEEIAAIMNAEWEAYDFKF